ncbi:MAG TPA: PaaI family thioesterase [Pseudomonadales bacterium]|nr:PaaI family thioesterase [Pseudomonadales bacterium]
MTDNYRFDNRASEQEITAHRAIVDHLRALNRLAITLHGEHSELQQLAEQTAQLVADYTQHDKHRLREYFAPLTQLARREGLQPYAPFGGSHNPITPMLHYHVEGDTVIAEGTFDLTHEGPIGCLHGGMIAGIYDCVLAAAMVLNQCGGPTAQLNIRYISPTPLHQPLRFSSRVARIDGKKVFIEGACHHGETLLSTAEAIFINNHKKAETTS